MQNLTQETILATRKFFADNDLLNIEEVRIGLIKVDDPDGCIEWLQQQRTRSLAGKNDHTFTFRQRAWSIQTGECIPLLS